MPKNTYEPTHYQASEIKVLEGLEPVRKRPGMYIGSTDSRGLHHLAKEILDNAVDEAIAGYGKYIQLFRSPINEIQQSLIKQLDIPVGQESITVVDNGRGIPVDTHSSGVSALEVVLTKLHAGGKFEETAYQASGGLHGVGSSAVNALSAILQVIVKRDKKYYYQWHSRGVPQIAVSVITESEVKKLFPIQSKRLIEQETGTLLTFIPDPTIFPATEFSHRTLVTVIKDRAYLMAGIYFELTDRIEDTHQHYYFESGIRSLVEHINMNRKPLHSVAYCEGVWKDENTGKSIAVEVALQFNDSFKERLDSYVNVINTPDGGAHVNGFRMALSRVLRDYAEKHELIKEKESFTSEDLKEGVSAVVFVKMPANDLQFESQTKTRLNNSEAQSAVYQIFKEGLTTYLEEHPAAGKAIIDKVMLSARARMAARAAKDAVVRKSVFESNSLPGKLADCQSRVPAESEIYIVEGDSAGGCFSGDTKVALADGRNLSFVDLVREQEMGKQHFCYTIRKNGKIGLQKAIFARKTKTNATVVKVLLDNGEEIICTPNHKFMLRNGKYCQAKDLTPQTSLMPLYRKLSDISEPRITIDGYEMVWDPSSDSWLFTHLLADWYNRWQGNYKKLDGDHCHHLDFNKHNNNPSNIQRLPKSEHLELHRQLAKLTLHRPDVIEKSRRLRRTAAFRLKMSQRMKDPKTSAILSKKAKLQWENPTYKSEMKQAWLNFYKSNPEYQQITKDRLNLTQKKYWSDQENRNKQAERVTAYFQNNPQAKEDLAKKANLQWQNQENKDWRRQETRKQWTDVFRIQRKKTLNKTYYQKTVAALKLSETDFGPDIQAFNKKRIQSRDKNILKFESFVDRYFDGNVADAVEAISNYNHKVVSVTPIEKKIDVYDLEVPGTHNFALASGIFVHNSAKQGRDRRFQAIFPLRGKILNTERARIDRIIASEEIKNLVIALGAGIGESYDENKLRYHRIILMNDADVDGEHITTLGLTFFFRHLPAIVEEGYLYIAMPPLYKVTYNKVDRYVYDEAGKDSLINQIKTENPNANISLQRYKGLGEMNPEQLWDTTMNPESRMLKKVTIEDLDKADSTFSTLMGDDVAPRKKFIQTHAKLAEIDV